MTTEQEAPFLELKDVVLDYRDGRFRPKHRVLDGVNFTVMRGETVAIVGESGSGKTTIAKAILGLARIASGQILLNGQDISSWSAKQRKSLVMDLQIVYQDPYRSLSPTRRIEQSLAEPVLAQEKLSREEMIEKSSKMLELVGLRVRRATEVSVAVLGRRAPAHRDRSRADALTSPGHLRRAPEFARRVDPGTGAESVGRLEGFAPAQLSLYLPQHPRRSLLCRQSGGPS